MNPASFRVFLRRGGLRLSGNVLLLSCLCACSFSPDWKGAESYDGQASTGDCGADCASIQDTSGGVDTVDTGKVKQALRDYLTCIHKKGADAVKCKKGLTGPELAKVEDLDRCRRYNCAEWEQDPTNVLFDPKSLASCLLVNCLKELDPFKGGEAPGDVCVGFFVAAPNPQDSDLVLAFFAAVFDIAPLQPNLALLSDMLPCYFDWLVKEQTLAGSGGDRCPCFDGCSPGPAACK